jgi:hypothetical protein
MINSVECFIANKDSYEERCQKILSNLHISCIMHH